MSGQTNLCRPVSIRYEIDPELVKRIERDWAALPEDRRQEALSAARAYAERRIREIYAEVRRMVRMRP